MAWPCLSLLVVIPSALGCGAPDPLWSAPLLDQSYVGPETDTSGGLSVSNLSFERAQTFTVGIAGAFHHADIYVNGGPVLSARLLATTGGVPNGTVLATTELVSPTEDGWISLDFSAGGVTVAVGEVLALEPFSTGGPGWRGQTGDPYPGGADAFRNPGFGYPDWTLNTGTDRWFRTYVDDGTPTAPMTWGSLKQLYR